MAYVTETIIASRIAWCQHQKTQVQTQSEFEGWSAEETGLRDALLNRDHKSQYRYRPSGVLERYVMGFEDGLALIRAGAVEQLCASSE